MRILLLAVRILAAVVALWVIWLLLRIAFA